MKLFDSLCYNRSYLLQHRNCLKAGIYILQPNLRTYKRLSFNKEKCNLPLTHIGGLKFYILYFLRYLFTIVIWRDGVYMCGRTAYFSNTPNYAERDLKIFDIKSKRIYIVVGNEQRFENFLNNRAVTSNHFPMPIVSNINKEQCSYVEEYIENCNNATISIKVLSKIWDFYRGYYEEAELTQSNYNVCDNLIKAGINNASTDNNLITLAIHHGDLSRDNFIINSEGKLFFIDFEHQNQYPLYYDFFYLLINCIVVMKDDVDIESCKKEIFDRYSGYSSVLDFFLQYIATFYEEHKCVFKNPNNPYTKIYKRFIEVLNSQK